MINHFFGYDVTSSIFLDLFNYLNRYSVFNHRIIKKTKISDQNIIHFHKLSKDIKIYKHISSVVTVHHDIREIDKFHNIGNWLDNYRKVENFICLNSNQINFLKTILDNKKYYLIPHGYSNLISTEDLNKKFKDRDTNKIRIGFFSKRYPRLIKGEQYFYDLVNRLNNKKFSFLLYGSNRSVEYKYLKECGFDVELYFDLPHHLLVQLYNNVDIQIILSGYEGGPASLVESLASGIPIISFNVGMVSDYIENDFNGYIVQNIFQIIEILNLLQSNDKKIEQMSRNCLKTENMMSWQDISFQHDKIYNEILYS